jgi:hypothetical protein
MVFRVCSDRHRIVVDRDGDVNAGQLQAERGAATTGEQVHRERSDERESNTSIGHRESPSPAV